MPDEADPATELARALKRRLAKCYPDVEVDRLLGASWSIKQAIGALPDEQERVWFEHWRVKAVGAAVAGRPFRGFDEFTEADVDHCVGKLEYQRHGALQQAPDFKRLHNLIWGEALSRRDKPKRGDLLKHALGETSLEAALAAGPDPANRVEAAKAARRRLSELQSMFRPADWHIIARSDSDAALADRYGLTPAGVRKRRQTLRRRLATSLRKP